MPDGKIIALNRQARYQYYVVETYEAGITLKGSEVKAIREGKVNLRDSFAKVDKGEMFLFNADISPYRYDQEKSYEAKRTRKLLLHRREILYLSGKTEGKGLTLIPLQMYFKGGKVKIEIALAKGKKFYDKREALKRRSIEKEIKQAVKGR